MRAKIAVLLVLAGGIAGCASTPPPPPPMAAVEPAPAPPPAPMMTGPVDGMYKGTAVLSDDSSRRCRRVPATASTRVRNNMFTLDGMRGRIGSDGNVTATPHRGATMTGMLANGFAGRDDHEPRLQPPLYARPQLRRPANATSEACLDGPAFRARRRGRPHDCFPAMPRHSGTCGVEAFTGGPYIAA